MDEAADTAFMAFPLAEIAFDQSLERLNKEVKRS